MKNLGLYIRSWREMQGMSMQSFAAHVGIDQALVSKYESGKRLPSGRHLQALSDAMGVPLQDIRKEYLADKIADLLKYEFEPKEILMLAESRVEYLSTKESLEVEKPSAEVQDKLNEADRLKALWQAKKPLNKAQLEKLSEYFDVSYTFDSNRIEGNTLTLQETHLVVNEGITISGKSMREHLEAINHAEAIEWVRQLSFGHDRIDRRALLDIHRMVLKSIDNENAGVFRKVGVRISGSEHVPPDALHVEELMTDFFAFYARNANVLHPVILAAELHERLVSVHPFVDGNGRTARLLMNFVLLRQGYTLAILKGDLESRLAYYKALEHVQVHNNPEPFYHLVLDRLIASLKEHLSLT
ncbi:Fic family protein [Marinilongibacter aquaticus]|uniref:Fic family protein n=1 Tax=Marinilongibacter aquaticus TaxID=2975157 RepID=UPI0021BDE7F2|nr:Fic family protein [Marinilongibacter aquaticus]UBM57722.1 Fic family protein [Marinilongibacter aquaticus]